MPGLSVRSAAKDMSRGKRASAAKNIRRVETALRDELEFCTYGKVSKALGNKMFLVQTSERTEHLCHIRGKMVWVSPGDVVLLNVRDYESRHVSTDAVYDIMALFTNREISCLVRNEQIPRWMASKGDSSDELADLFDYDNDEDALGTQEHYDKKDKKNHRLASKAVVKQEADSDVDIDAI